jgi:hypothetical protein
LRSHKTHMPILPVYILCTARCLYTLMCQLIKCKTHIKTDGNQDKLSFDGGAKKPLPSAYDGRDRMKFESLIYTIRLTHEQSISTTDFRWCLGNNVYIGEDRTGRAEKI